MANLFVRNAVYGALPDGDGTNAQAFDVTSALQTLIDLHAGVVSCDNNSFGDPAQGFNKHFGAVVNRDGTDFSFACDEGQTIDFNHGGGVIGPSSDLVVKFAVYGALPNGDPSAAEAADVTAVLQALINQSGGPVACDNNSFGDPAVGFTKHFAAVVNRGGADLHFACQEGQTIDFRFGGQ
jgi:hypothetical protein